MPVQCYHLSDDVHGKIIMGTWYKRLKLIHYYLVILSIVFIEINECKRNTCCEVINIVSNGFLAKFHPEHLGSYKLMKNSKHIYKSLTEPKSYIYLLKIGKGITCNIKNLKKISK